MSSLSVGLLVSGCHPFKSSTPESGVAGMSDLVVDSFALPPPTIEVRGVTYCSLRRSTLDFPCPP